MIAIFSDELENVKQLNFSLQKFESNNIEFEKKCSDLHNSLQEEICLKGPKNIYSFWIKLFYFILEVASIDH
jgi:hypothetical protein